MTAGTLDVEAAEPRRDCCNNPFCAGCDADLLPEPSVVWEWLRDLDGLLRAAWDARRAEGQAEV